VAARVKMFSGVAIRRRVAAADMTARQAEAQVQLRRTDSQAIFTAPGMRRDRADI